MKQKTYNDVEHMMLEPVQRDIQLSRAVLPVAGIASTDPKVISSQQPSNPTGLESSDQGFATSSWVIARRRGSSVSLPFSATPQQTSVSFGTGTNPQYDAQGLLPSSSRSDLSTPPLMTMASGSPGTVEVESLDGSPQYAETLFQYVLRRQSLPDTCTAKAPNVPTSSSRYVLAHSIKDFRSIEYPDGVQGPNLELNKYSEGRFRYDREFLLQFMSVCEEKPKSLPSLSAFGLEPSMMRPAPFCGGPGRRGDFAKGSVSSPTPLQAPGGTSISKKRTRTKRDKKYSEQNLPCQQPAFGSNAAAQAAMMLEPVAPLEVSANRWTPASLVRKPSAVEEDSSAIVDRKVKSLLNKLTMENFDSISDQIILWANKSETENDAHTLIQIIQLVFEQVIDDAACPVEMYARLCRKMMEQISPKVQDDGIRSSEGKHITGGHLFRKYLLNRCQEDFERRWVFKEAAAAVAAAKAGEDKAAKDAGAEDKIALYSDEYYAAQKAKRQDLGLIKFIGEVFKLQMLTERIMHECVKKLLGNVANPEEEEIESLCKLLTIVGALLDSPKARVHMNVYFSLMKELTKSPNVNSRIRFMLQDVIELRERRWAPRYPNATLLDDAATKLRIAETRRLIGGFSGGVAICSPRSAGDLSGFSKIGKTRLPATFGPASIFVRKEDMSCGDSSRSAERNEHRQIGPDGWPVAGAGAAARPPTTTGGLSQFGKIGKTGPPATFGPTSIFANKKENKRESISRTGSANMFSVPSQNPKIAAEALNASKSSRPPIRKPSIDLGAGDTPDAPLARRKLNLLPRSVPKSDDKAESTPAASTVGSEDEGGDTVTPGMSEAEIKARIDEDSKEFFGICDLGKAETYFTKLPVKHRHRLVDKLVMSALDPDEADATLVADFFSRAVCKNLCSPATFEDGFMQSAEILDDVAIDAPEAPSLFVKMMKGAGLDRDEVRRTRLVGKSTYSGKLLRMLSA